MKKARTRTLKYRVRWRARRAPCGRVRARSRELLCARVCSLIDESAVGDLDATIDYARDVGFVSRDHHCSALIGHVTKQIENCCGCDRVEIAGRLVGKDQRWLVCECAR